MSVLFYLFIFFFGASLASFACLIAMRYLRQESIISPSSYCHHCHEPLCPIHLIPVLSYLVQGGKSHCCRKLLPVTYFLTEVFGGVMALLLYHLAASLGQVGLAIQVGLSSFFAIIFCITDFTAYILPNSIMAIFTLFSFLHLLVFNANNFWPHLFISLLVLLILFIFYSFHSERFGGGDIKLIFAFCLLYGPELCLPIVFLASALALVTFFMALLNNKKLHQLPFGPFLFASALLTLFVEHFFF